MVKRLGAEDFYTQKGPSTPFLRFLAPRTMSFMFFWDQSPQILGTWTLWGRYLWNLVSLGWKLVFARCHIAEVSLGATAAVGSSQIVGKPVANHFWPLSTMGCLFGEVVHYVGLLTWSSLSLG